MARAVWPMGKRLLDGTGSHIQSFPRVIAFLFDVAPLLPNRETATASKTAGRNRCASA